MLADAEPLQLLTHNIQHLAIDLANFERVPRLLLGCHPPFFSSLKELIVLAEEDDQAAQMKDEGSGISAAQHMIPRLVHYHQKETPNIRFPVVKVMTEAMLLESMS